MTQRPPAPATQAAERVPAWRARLARVHKWAIGAALLYIGALLAYSQWPVRVGGEEFRAIFDESGQHSASSWSLYSETPAEYSFRYSRGLLPARVCVSKREVEINPRVAAGDRYLRQGDIILLAGRRPGAKRETF